MVTNKNARMLKFSCWYPSHIRTSPSCYITKSSSTNDFWYTSMSFLCCFGAWISTNIMMNFHFTQTHDGRLQIHRFTSAHFNERIHATRTQIKPYVPCIHCKISTSHRACVLFFCHHINLAYTLFLNKHFKCGIIRECNITLEGTLSPVEITIVISFDLISLKYYL